MILRVNKVELSGEHWLTVSFSEGTTKTVNVRPILEGPVFKPLHDPAYFAKVKLDPVCGTVVWPNGADLAPEALYELAAIDEPVRA